MKSQGAAKNEANNVAQAKTVSEKPVEKIDFSKVEIEPLFKDEVDFETFSKSDFRAVKVKECVAVPKSKKLLQFTLDDGTGVERTILSGIHAFYEPEELVGRHLNFQKQPVHLLLFEFFHQIFRCRISSICFITALCPLICLVIDHMEIGLK